MARLIPKEITENGWYLYTTCKCGGVLQYKFRNMDYKGLQLSWYPDKYQFRVKNVNKTKIALTPIAELESVLKTIKKEWESLEK